MTIEEAVDLKKYYEREDVKKKHSQKEHKSIMDDLHKTIFDMIIINNNNDL